MIREIKLEDAPQVCEIYNYYIENTTITFEEDPITLQEMRERVVHITQKYPWFVEEESGIIIGYAYANRWKERSAYRFTVETSVYVRDAYRGRGIGTRLMERLLSYLKEANIHTVIAGISLPNESSVRLHEKLGFQWIAQFPEVGYKFGRWLDVGYWFCRL